MKTFQFYAGPVVACIEVLNDEHGVVDEDPDMEGQWFISDFFSKEKRSGRAKECLMNVVNAAREAGIRYIALHPWARDGIDQDSLVALYESVGFTDCGFAHVRKV
jgi:GNAT superfamily N-acetyltransferase